MQPNDFSFAGFLRFYKAKESMSKYMDLHGLSEKQTKDLLDTSILNLQASHLPSYGLMRYRKNIETIKADIRKQKEADGE